MPEFLFKGGSKMMGIFVANLVRYLANRIPRCAEHLPGFFHPQIGKVAEHHVAIGFFKLLFKFKII
jgi:hypothetical protein